MLDELLELEELAELLRLDQLELETLEELLSELVMEELELLPELLELSSSMPEIDNRSPLEGPGNCKWPVLNGSSTAGPTAPPVAVSTSLAIQRRLSARATVAVDTAPTSALYVAAMGSTSPASGSRVIVSCRADNPVDGPS